MLVGKNLYLNVARAFEIAFEHQGIVTEGRRSFAPGAGQRLGEFARLTNDTHAFATTARARLDQQRITYFVSRRSQVRIRRPLALMKSRQGRHASLCHAKQGGILEAHGLDGRCRGTDETQAGVLTSTREGGVFREEAVTRVNRLAAGCPSRLQHRICA